jgi:hypothetical protein
VPLDAAESGDYIPSRNVSINYSKAESEAPRGLKPVVSPKKLAAMIRLKVKHHAA